MEKESYNIFWQRLHNLAKDKQFPLRVMFELTYRCNFKCKHCYLPPGYKKKKGELKTKEIFSIIDQLKEIGCFYLGFTGGEPFLRKDIMQVLWYAKRSGFEVIIYTNGSLINAETANQLQHLRPNKIDITIPAMKRDIFESISGEEGSYNQVFRTIRLLHKKGVNLGFKTCLLKENESQINKIQDFSRALGVFHRLDDMLSSRLDGSKEPYKYKGCFLNANRRKSSANLGECINEHISINPRTLKKNVRLFKCGVGETQAAITPFGELKLCLMIDYPKYVILDSRLKNCWQRLKKLVQDIKPDENYQCDTCGLQAYCKWCPARAWLAHKNFTSCNLEDQVRARELFQQDNKEGLKCLGN